MAGMSEKLLKFILSELRTVRIICRKSDCQAIVELPIDQLDVKYHVAQCPFCRTLLQHPNQPNHLGMLAQAVVGLAACKNIVDVEFVLPDRG